MAQKQTVPKIPGSFLDGKYRQAAAGIAGKGRRILFDTGFRRHGVSGLVTPSVVLFSKKFSSRYFGALGDSISFTFCGFFIAIGADVEGVYIKLLDENGSEILRIMDTFSYTAAGLVNFYGMGHFTLIDGGDIQGGAGIMTSDLTAPNYVQRVTSAVFPSKRFPFITFEIVSESTAVDVNAVTINRFQAEVSPAFIT